MSESDLVRSDIFPNPLGQLGVVGIGDLRHSLRVAVFCPDGVEFVSGFLVCDYGVTGVVWLKDEDESGRFGGHISESVGGQGAASLFNRVDKACRIRLL